MFFAYLFIQVVTCSASFPWHFPSVNRSSYKTGQIDYGCLYLRKNGGDPVNINVKMASFEPKDNLGNVRIKNQLEGPIRFNLDNSDIELNTPFFLKSLSSQQLLLRIRVPENIKNGDYYYSLLAETVPAASTEGVGSAQAKATIGANILITVTDWSS